MKATLAIACEHETVNAGNCKTCRGIRGKGHVKSLRERGWIQHCSDRIDVDGLAVDESKACGCVHPCVRDDDEDAGECAAHGDHHACKQMCAWWNARPAVKIDS